jgi:hypothetical protein
MQETTIYDLGEVGIDPTPARAEPSTRRPPAPREAARTTFTPVVAAAPAPYRGFGFAGSLSLFLPGAGQLARRQWTAGLFFISSLGFLVTLGWALLVTLGRLTETLAVLGHPRETGVWALGLLYLGAAVLHVWSVLSGASTADYGAGPPHPVLAGAASLLLPGWGQVLNGDHKRAALFLSSLWVIGAAWILAAPQTQQLLFSLDLYLPSGLMLFCSAAVRWTLPAVVWSLAVYDAAASAAGRR